MARTPALKKGRELQEEIARTQLAGGQAAVWWLGQASFCFKLGQAVIYTDLYYRDEDELPETLQELPLRPEEFTGAALLTGSHNHSDHVDPQTLPGAAQASPEAAILIPACAWDTAVRSGVPEDRLHGMRGDDTFETAGVRVTAIPAAHQRLEYSEAFGYHYLGYVFEGNGVTIYHPGDIQPYAGWSERVRRFKLDIACLPINNNDNLHYAQAVYFCADHRPALAIPMHYGLFAGNTEDPAKFTNLLALNVPDQAVRVLQVGERLIYGGF